MGNGIGVEEEQAEAVIRRLDDRKYDLPLRHDFDARERFDADDFVVTNPFNMFIDKPKVMERIRADIIKYSTYERGNDDFRRYGIPPLGSKVRPLCLPRMRTARTPGGPSTVDSPKSGCGGRVRGRRRSPPEQRHPAVSDRAESAGSCVRSPKLKYLSN